MGYTHYWYRPEQLGEETFAKAAKDCLKVCKALSVNNKIRIVQEYDNSKAPVFKKGEVHFNGFRDNGHETFYLPVYLKQPDYQKDFTENKGLVFAFCKTACKPYDLNVTACLIVFKHHFGDNFKVSSDGESPDWDKAREACQKFLGYGKDFKIDNDDD